ncbi:hypothetical protein M1B72_09850 [Geomonas paludis]|uniref:Uncharacterized protein n=1 Tax=Geomonas paludis TaxID=2740185 RepID=A0A6V8MUU5_9BACT|nr:hypothetical protein [Geomonas paludis]UPU37990.1 hypothetical protein M1B72_09850 [Geomonas paludis]GFO63487.1 hypothetical protein GMPD_14060 [Geomonas paludis]
MLRFLHSIFRRGTKSGAVPDSLVNKAIERAVDGTDPWIRAVFGYKKKLRPAVIHAIDHVVALVDGTGPVLPLDPQSYDSNPNLRTYFLTASEMGDFLKHEPNLVQLRGKRGNHQHGATALLLMEKRERMTLGASLSGDVVLRDVPQVSVSFEAHRLMDLNGNEEETRYQLKRRAYDHLLRIALGRITELKTRRGNLEKHRILLSSKLSLLQRGGFGFDPRSGRETDVAGLEQRLADIEAQLLAMGKDDKMLDVYLGVVADVLGRAEEHLWLGKETLVVDRMGIKRREAGVDAREVSLDVLCDAEGRKLVVSLVSIPA